MILLTFFFHSCRSCRESHFHFLFACSLCMMFLSFFVFCVFLLVFLLEFLGRIFLLSSLTLMIPSFFASYILFSCMPADSKKTSDDIAERSKTAREVEKKIDEARIVYVPVAYRASILFFCIADLATVDPMYQFSLQWYAFLFVSFFFLACPENHEALILLSLFQVCHGILIIDSQCRIIE